jgi:hypothetical protein
VLPSHDFPVFVSQISVAFSESCRNKDNYLAARSAIFSFSSALLRRPSILPTAPNKSIAA